MTRQKTKPHQGQNINIINIIDMNILITNYNVNII